MNDAVARSADIGRDLSFEKGEEGVMPGVMAEL
jgi:hypothetical protein